MDMAFPVKTNVGKIVFELSGGTIVESYPPSPPPAVFLNPQRAVRFYSKAIGPIQLIPHSYNNSERSLQQPKIQPPAIFLPFKASNSGYNDVNRKVFVLGISR